MPLEHQFRGVVGVGREPLALAPRPGDAVDGHTCSKTRSWLVQPLTRPRLFLIYTRFLAGSTDDTKCK